MEASLSLFDNIAGSAEERMAFIVATMREMSLQTDPAEMRRQYAARMRQVLPTDAVVSLSRRDLRWPKYRVTRSSRWTEEINPWKQQHLLPLYEGGLIAELIYGDEPRLFDDLDIDPDDPAAEYLNGYRSMLAIPTYDRGEALNMVLLLRREPHAFSREQFPEVVWMSNLFGRATAHLLTSERLKQAYESVDYEMKVVGEIQRSLLPAKMPVIPTLAVAASYQTSHRAGGDYYDFFPLPEGKWGILIADVSGHGTPAAVLMAVTHSLAPHLSRPADAAQRDARLSQRQARRAVHDAIGYVRDRVLRHLQPGRSFADVFLRGPQSAASEALSGRHADALNGARSAAGHRPRHQISASRRTFSFPAMSWCCTPTASRKPTTAAANCLAWNDSTKCWRTAPSAPAIS